MQKIKKIFVFCFILFLFGCGIMKERELEQEKFNQFKEKVANASISLADWRYASIKEKYYFAENYTKDYFGTIDYTKSKSVIEFLDSSINNLTKTLMGKGLKNKDIDKFLGTNAVTTMNAGARLMGWEKNK